MTTPAEAIDLPFEEAIAYFKQKTRIPTERWSDVWKEAHARGFMVAGAASDALLKDFQDAIQKALSKGTSAGEFRKDFDAIVKRHGWKHTGKPGWRASIIYDTNMANAYAAGRYAQMSEPAVLKHFPYWQYRHTACANPRLMHLSWDGMTLRADDPWWDEHYPPNGWRCGCRVASVSREGLARMGKRGPDTAPARQTREWVDPKTGEIHQVPVGVDPGFDWNPGKAWKAGQAAQMPVQASPLRPVGSLPAAAPPVVPREFEGVAQADQALTDAFSAWSAALGADQRQAVALYKGRAGRRVNAGLRANAADAVTGGIVAALQSALQRASLPFGVRVFRGVDAAEAALYRARGAGRKIVVPGFFSTALDAEVAAKLSDGGEVIEVLAPAGLPGVAYVHPTPGFRYRQFELLLNSGMTFRIVRAGKEGIVLEAIHAGD